MANNSDPSETVSPQKEMSRRPNPAVLWLMLIVICVGTFIGTESVGLTAAAFGAASLFIVMIGAASEAIVGNLQILVRKK